MRLPTGMRELESRCWTLAGERMINEPLTQVMEFADTTARNLIVSSVEDPREPVAAFFNDPLNEQLAEVVSRYEWRAVAFALLGWAGAEKSARVPFIATIDGLPDPAPEHERALRRWVLDHGLIARMDDPLAVAAALAPTHRARHDAIYSAHATVRDAIEGRVQRRSKQELRVAALSYLAWVAGRALREAHYRELAQHPVDNRDLADAARRVRNLIDDLDEAEVPAGPVPVAGSEFRFDPDALTLTLDSRDGTVWLSLVERRGERACSSWDSSRARRAALPGLFVLAERTWEALVNPDHEEHGPIREALTAPRWTRLLTELEREVVEESEPERPFSEDERLVFRVGLDPSAGLEVEPAVQRRKKRGWTKGRRLDWSMLQQRGVPLERRDALPVETWYGRGARGAAHSGQGDVAEALIGHPLVILKDDPSVFVRVKRASLAVAVIEDRGHSSIRFSVDDHKLDATELLAHVTDHHIVRLDPINGTMSLARLPESMRAMAAACSRWSTRLPPEADDALLKLMERLPRSVGVELPPRLRGEHRAANATPTLRLDPLPGGGLRAQLTVRPLPMLPAQSPGIGPTHLVGVEDGKRVHAVRDLAEERRAMERCIATLGMESGLSDGAFTILFEEPELALDLLSALNDHPEVAHLEWPKDATAWKVVGRASSSSLKVRTQKLDEWFALTGEVTLNEEKIALAKVMAALRAGQRYVQLSKSRFAEISEELRAKLERAGDVVFQDGKNLAVAGSALETVEAILGDVSFDPDAAWKRLRANLAAVSSVDAGVPKGVDATLREYQTEGIGWLLRVASWSTGACLADDMGLGKTLQALALIEARAESGPALVVCPTSLSDNWRREAERFTPGLCPVLYRGPERQELLASIGPRDVVLASYEVMSRDIERLAELELSTVVFDEAHMLKNPDAKRSRAARQLKAEFRLALTGTPLENHLGELHSLFSILTPGLLGPKAHFRRRFSIPIERDGDLARREGLRGLLRPFLLRRTKAQVAPELPPRVDVVRTIELATDERALYEAERRHALEQVADKDPKKTRFAVLAALTRLRRLACHPRLVDADSTVESSKLATALSLLEDLAAEGHRTLVFSQFTTHLAIVRRALLDRGDRLLYLDGSTPAKKRGQLVDAWQSGDEPYFLISLKAGGTGLNLTAADTVVHLDPWWNPAAEDQASDRTHRIGQHRPVTVIRLVSQHTIEEAVVALHEHKRELARGILEGAETNAKLSADDLLGLLRGEG